MPEYGLVLGVVASASAFLVAQLGSGVGTAVHAAMAGLLP
jgi:hypothetical protein